MKPPRHSEAPAVSSYEGYAKTLAHYDRDQLVGDRTIMFSLAGRHRPSGTVETAGEVVGNE